MPTLQEINNYYLGSKLDYQIYNGCADNLSMHYGLWDDTVRSHREALLNENRVVAQAVNISPGDYVVDLGCGYGSTAVWLATNVGCRVLGITISQEQVEDATMLAQKHGVARLVEFQKMDFHRTAFDSSTFDVALAIESVAHSSRKESVLREAWRILASGGRIAVADGFFRKPKACLTDREQTIARTCFEGVHVPPLPERLEFESWLADVGFEGITWFDKTDAILPTSRRVNRLGKFLLPLSWIFKYLGVKALQPLHMQAFINQYYAFRDGLGTYGIFIGRKPAQVSAARAVEPEEVPGCRQWHQIRRQPSF